MFSLLDSSVTFVICMTVGVLCRFAIPHMTARNLRIMTFLAVFTAFMSALVVMRPLNLGPTALRFVTEMYCFAAVVILSAAIGWCFRWMNKQ